MPPSFRSLAGRRAAAAAVGLTLAVLALPLAAQVNEKVDYDAIMRIKDEGFGRSSRVMEFASWLTDVYGPRLTNSPQYKAAGEYVRKQMTELGFVNVKLEPWGPFGRGWSQRVHQRPRRRAVHGDAARVLEGLGAWHQRTAQGRRRPRDAREGRGPREGQGHAEGQVRPAAARAGREAAVRGAWPPLQRGGPRQADARERDAAAACAAVVRPSRASRTRSATWRPRSSSARSARRSSSPRASPGIISPSTCARGDSGSVCVAPCRPAKARATPRTRRRSRRSSLASEHYGRLVRTLEKKLPVSVEADVKNTFFDDGPDDLQRRRRAAGHRQGGRGRACSARTSTRGTPARAPPTTGQAAR